MSFLSALNEGDRAIVESFFRPVSFPKDARILAEGEPGNGCYLIDSGEVRLELSRVETDSDSVLGYLKAGAFLGELSLCDGQPRSASAFAESEVQARWFGRDDFRKLCAEHPSIGNAITQALVSDVSGKLREMNRRLAEYLFADEVDAATDDMVHRAGVAQQEFASWPEEKVDGLVQDVARAVSDRAAELAEATVRETRMGNAADKTAKNRFASLEVARSLVGRRAAGVLGVHEARRITEIAVPVGVVFGMIPVTNPVATIVFKALVCLKSRNAFIYSCHRNALGVGGQVGELIQSVLRRHAAPADLVLWIRERTSRRTTAMFMKHPKVSLILATGGPSMVRAAYSSGTPSLGVGSGNAPCWMAPDADLAAAAACIVRSKSFDCGVICGSENNLVVDSAVHDEFVKALEEAGAAVLSDEEKRRFVAGVFDAAEGHLAKAYVGRPATEMAAAYGIQRPREIRLLVVPAGAGDLEGPLAMEKLSPILSLFAVTGDDHALATCKAILRRSGIGHTAIVHTRNEGRVRRFGLEISASRVLVNVPGAQGCIGLGTGLAPSLTLGCGTFGGNSTTDNVTFTHLLNIKRVAAGL